MTPRYPGANWMPVGQDHGPNNGPRACSWHEAVTTGNEVAIAGWVSQGDNCHAFIGKDGDMAQYKDWDRVAYGVYEGNQRGVVTIETWDDLIPYDHNGFPGGTSADGSHGPNDFAWTPQQVERIADVIAWMNTALGIPIHFMGSTREAGHAPHRLGVPQATGRVDVGYGPDQWTTHPGKECPGDVRITQLRDVCLPRAAQLVAAGAGVLPDGPVDLAAAHARGSSDWFDAASVLDVARACK